MLGVSLGLLCLVWVCAQRRREVLYMTSRFHSNVIGAEVRSRFDGDAESHVTVCLGESVCV